MNKYMDNDIETYTFPYYTGIDQVTLNSHHVLYKLKSRSVPVIADEEAAVRRSLRQPDDHVPLNRCVRKNGSVVIIVSDITRAVHTDVMLRAIVAELNDAGVRDEQITVLIALGTHRRQTSAETEAVCGRDMMGRLRIVQHDCRDNDQLVTVGTTSFGNVVRLNRLAVHADTLILTGAVSFHDMAGFGGGRKAVLPGIAAYDTIMYNHALALDDTFPDGMNPRCDAGILSHNPIHEDMLEGAALIQPDFLVNLVLTADGELASVVSGHWQTAWLEGCRRLLAIDSISIDRQADVVIGSAGGYPKDINLYQATKAHMNGIFAVKPGGMMILAMACPDIYEPAAFTDWFFRNDLEKELTDLKADFTIPAFSAYKTRCLMKSLQAVYIVTEKKNFEIIRRTGEIPAGSLQEAWQMAEQRLKAAKKRDYTITLMPYAAAVLPLYKK